MTCLMAFYWIFLIASHKLFYIIWTIRFRTSIVGDRMGIILEGWVDMLLFTLLLIFVPFI